MRYDDVLDQQPVLDDSEVWAVCEGFDRYEVSSLGRVRNSRTGEMLKNSPNQRGLLRVSLYDDESRHTALVSHLVAEAFVRRSPFTHHDTIIHLNGARFDCRASNLLWRERKFAQRYHGQFARSIFINSEYEIEDIKTGRVYARVADACSAHGLLASEIIISMQFNEAVAPTWQMFRRVDGFANGMRARNN